MSRPQYDSKDYARELEKCMAVKRSLAHFTIDDSSGLLQKGDLFK
jgi:hypothetical protein